LEKWLTPAKIGHSCKNSSNLEKMGQTWKDGLHSEKWLTLGKIGHSWKNGSNLKKWFKLEK